MHRRSLMHRRCIGAGIAVVLLCLGAAVSGKEDRGKIMRPVDGAALSSGEVDIVATAPAGKLQLDGAALVPDEPFPNVFHAAVTAGPGKHTLALVWEGGRKEVNFFVGENPPSEYKPFSQHPPLAGVECTQCHGVSRRGRFRFKGGCFDCHQKEDFTKVHPHPVHMIQDCGMCHNAHGSTVKAHLIMPKELACKQCHN